MRMRNRRKNPMPTTGALFLQNPRRKGKRTVSLKSIFRKNPLFLLKNRRKNPRRRNFQTQGRRNPTFLLKNRRKNARRRKNGWGALSITVPRTNGRRRHKRNPTFLLKNRKQRRKNGIAVMTNGRRRNGIAVNANGRRRNYRRKNGIAVNANGRRRNRARRNGFVRVNRRRNSGLSFLSPITSAISRIPIIGPAIANALAPAIGGALAIGAVHLVLTYGAPYIPDAIAPWVTPIGYTLGGVTLGIIVAFIPASMLSSQTKASIAALAVAGGAAVDAIRYLSDGSGDDATAGIGDGGLWQLGSDDASGLDGDGQAMASEYADASLLDALQCGDDFSLAEGQAAFAGPRTWRASFPGIRSTRRAQDGTSRHAGRHGHRWGWLCRLIGVTRFSALAKLPAPTRQRYIAELKQHASLKADELQLSQSASSPMGRFGALLLAQ